MLCELNSYKKSTFKLHYHAHTRMALGIRDICQAYRGLPAGFLCSGIQFYLLLSPYFCFMSFLYLDLYVLGDDASIS